MFLRLVLFPLQDTATTCRERCGGQGYLSCNRFGAILGFAHAGMTAEGDNRRAPYPGYGLQCFRFHVVSCGLPVMRPL